MLGRRVDNFKGFNSRPSCEGRLVELVHQLLDGGFNSRPSCEGRRDGQRAPRIRDVSIHAPRVRGDNPLTRARLKDAFQFTPLV